MPSLLMQRAERAGARALSLSASYVVDTYLDIAISRGVVAVVLHYVLLLW